MTPLSTVRCPRHEKGVLAAMCRQNCSERAEQNILRTSIIATLVISALGLVLGFLSGSSSIIFDSLYELTDAGMTFLALIVTRLIVASRPHDKADSKLTERFNMGFWHLEPLVLGLYGASLLSAAVYGLFNAFHSMALGGRELEFNYAIIQAAISLLVAVGMAVYTTRANRVVHSEFLALDAKAWLLSAELNLAWLGAFLFGYMVEGSRWAWLAPYVDPIALALVCLAVIPVPLASVGQALSDILLVTPTDLKKHVDSVAQSIVDRHGFRSYRAYVAKVGRGRQIELYFLVPPNRPAQRLEEWDLLRDEISEEIGYDTPDRWLSVVFTTDAEWT